MTTRRSAALGRLAAVALWALPSAAGAQGGPTEVPTCQGSVATIYVHGGRIVGGPDAGAPYRGVLRGTMADDVIVGTAGPDLIKGHAGNDLICAGDGDDIIEAGEGNDRVDAGPGNDLVKGQGGHDSLYGGDGDDRLEGGHANDQLDGGPGTHQVGGGSGINTCVNNTVGRNCLTSSASITVINALPQSTVCPNGNTVSVFGPGQQVIQPGGNSITVIGDFSGFPGLGIQVNNWYWTSVSLPVQTGPPQDPDNSGAQFAISDQCVLTQEPAWYGKGIPTFSVATVSAAAADGGCTITIAASPFTDAVTPGCCAPPGIGSSTCTGPWGVTNSGQPWPPS